MIIYVHENNTKKMSISPKKFSFVLQKTCFFEKIVGFGYTPQMLGQNSVKSKIVNVLHSVQTLLRSLENKRISLILQFFQPQLLDFF